MFGEKDLFLAKPALALHSPRWASSDKQNWDTVPTAQVLPGSPKGMVARGSDQLRPLIRSQCTNVFPKNKSCVTSNPRKG